MSRLHSRIPYLRKLPLAAILIILLLILVNLIVWAACGIVLAYHTNLLSTAALSYTLGLRHALDADHISAIDLMTRRLIATGQRPVTVGTFFSLGHSTIVIVTSIVVAATAAGVSSRFDSFGNVGGIIGTSVSAAFLILLGIMNAYILYKLIVQIQKVIRMQPDQAAEEAWKIEGGGVLFRVLKRMFKLIDRPWKMYPLGVLFGLGFDTSSEIALLGISSIEATRGTSIWLILIFPILFTAGMCLVDTTDGALMMSLYVAPMGMGGDDKKDTPPGPATDDITVTTQPVPLSDVDVDLPPTQSTTTTGTDRDTDRQIRPRIKDPLTFLYYSIVLTSLTVVCAIVIGMLQLLSLILNTAHPTGRFWDGVETAGEYYEVIGGAICGSFVVFGGLSVLCYRPWKRWVQRKRAQLRAEGELFGVDVGVAGPPYRDHVDGDEGGAAVARERRAAEVVVDAWDHTDGKPSSASESRAQTTRVPGKAYDSGSAGRSGAAASRER
ncbi:hypothetical protein LTR84_009509 [Exophiala bonariae]|uniref:Nickel/cobalt efflux system n=1 Tax=Exophiala bonariae TaxID=1690606 RepID=A0AAV9MU84_9EURO|nr:hypothetical protein LTR84_009509 [Exophiala bonariae]